MGKNARFFVTLTYSNVSSARVASFSEKKHAGLKSPGNPLARSLVFHRDFYVLRENPRGLAVFINTRIESAFPYSNV